MRNGADAILPSVVPHAHPDNCGKVMAMEAARYHADKTAVNQGALQTIEYSAAHFLEEWEKPYVDKDGSEEMVIGTLVHEALLEPENYSRRILRPDFGDMRFKENKEKKAEWHKGVPPGSKLIDHDHKIVVEAMAISALSQKEFSEALKIGQKEATIYWVDEATLILNRARLDLITPTVIWDVKTVAKFAAREEEFSKAIANNGYDFQGGHYTTAGDAVVGVTGHYVDYRFMVIEREPPYESQIFQLVEGALMRAKARRSVALRTLRAAIDLGRFEGYGQAVKPIDVPAWHKNKTIATEAF